MTLETINPFTGEILEQFEEQTPPQVEQLLEKAGRAFLTWRRTSFSDRARILRKAADLLRRNAKEYAAVMAREMGKPLSQGQGESEKCAGVCEYYAEKAEEFLRPELIPTDASKSIVRFEPLGTVLAIMPWNFPFWQVFRFAAPALMAGNVALLKHASNVLRCALTIETLLREAGLPDGAFQSLILSNSRVEAVIRHPVVQAVTLTGSTRAGQAVAAQAGAALKKTVLELGGSDPYLILEDADLGQAVETCAYSRLINSGQSCIAAKRFIVLEPVRKAFQERLVEAMRNQKMGYPFQEGETVGPLARPDLRDSLHKQVEKSIKMGALLHLGGKIPSIRGSFYPPTVLTDVRKGMPAYEEETFGPVAAVIPARNDEEAVQIANDSPFGLGAAVFTQDLRRGEEIATRLQAGCCFVNTFVKSDPRLPFGGIKQSGYGRELSAFGIREFVNIKTIYVK